MLVIDPANCPLFVAGDQTRLRELLHPGKHALELRYSLAIASLPPGATSTPHRLRTSEVYYILEGAGLMTINDETQRVTAGQSVYIPPNATQYIANEDATELRFLCIVDPAWRQEDEEVEGQ